jgi:hypothetical protein
MKLHYFVNTNKRGDKGVKGGLKIGKDKVILRIEIIRNNYKNFNKYLIKIINVI